MKRYSKLHQSFLQDGSVDMVSLEDIRSHGRNYIMYLRLATKTINNNTKINRIPVQLVPFDTYSAYDTFVSKKVSFDPETKLPLHQGFVERIILYKQTLDSFGTDFEPSSLYLEQLFSSYLQETPMDERDTLYLRSYLQVEDTTAIHEFNVVGLDIRTEAELLLQQKGNGSWLLRKSSIVDSELVRTKCLMYQNDEKCYNVLIVHVSGMGYYLGDVERGEVMPNVNDHFSIPKVCKNTIVYPCFIDLVHYLITYYKLSRKMYCSTKECKDC
jgi:hypothetical protein